MRSEAFDDAYGTVAVEARLERVVALGGDADGERVGAVGSSGGGAEGDRPIGCALEGDLFVGDSGAVGGEGA